MACSSNLINSSSKAAAASAQTAQMFWKRRAKAPYLLVPTSWDKSGPGLPIAQPQGHTTHCSAQQTKQRAAGAPTACRHSWAILTLRRMNLRTRKKRTADMMPERRGEMNQDNTRRKEELLEPRCGREALPRAGATHRGGHAAPGASPRPAHRFLAARTT